MGSLERRVESQVQFWSLLGPFLFLISIGVLIFKLSMHWYFPLSILVGIPLCVKWKIKGMAMALTLLFAITLFAYPGLNLEERYWHVGMALAMAFSFIILTLSLEEVEGVLSKLEIESKSRLENFLRLDDTTRKAEEAWVEAKVILDAQLAALTNDLAIALQDKEVFYKLAQLAKDELLQIRSQHELLQQDLTYKKHQIFQLNEKLEETEITLQSIIDNDNESIINALREELRQLEQNEEFLKAEINKLNITLEESLGRNKELDLLHDQLQKKSHEDELQLLHEKDSLLNAEKESLQLKTDLENSKHAESSFVLQLKNLGQELIEIKKINEELSLQCNHLKTIENKNSNELMEFNRERDRFYETIRSLEKRSEEVELDKLLLSEKIESYKKDCEKASIAETRSFALLNAYEMQIKELAKNVEENRQLEITCRAQLKEYEQFLEQIQDENEALNSRCNHLTLLETKYSEDKVQYEQICKKWGEDKQCLEEQLQDLKIEKLLLSESLEIIKKDFEKESDSRAQILRQLSDYQSQLKVSEQTVDELNRYKDEMDRRLTILLEDKENQRKSWNEAQYHLESQLEEVEIEKLLLSESLETTKKDFEMESDSRAQLLRQLSDHQSKLKASEQKIDELSHCKGELESRLAQLLDDKENQRKSWNEAQCHLQAQLEEVEIEKLLLSESLERMKKDFEKEADSKAQLSEHLSDYQSRLKESEQKIDELNHYKQELEIRLTKLNDENENQRDAFELLNEEKIRNIQSEFEKVLQEKDKELINAYEKLNNIQVLPKVKTLTEISSRQVESLYLQLKQQFQEKSQVLDQTRQELFNAHEKTLALQKTLEEQEIFSLSQSETLLQNEYRHLIKEYDKMQNEYSQEIEHLEGIICQLTISQVQ